MKSHTDIKKIRIGKDISLRWEITTDGVSTPLEGRDLTVELKSPIGKISNMPFRVDGNVLIMTYYGYEQTSYGEYSITLWENIGKPGQNVVDAISAFKLVRTSQEEDDFIGGELQVECVDLGTANLDILLGSATPGDSPDLSALKRKVDANTTKISAVENKNTEQDSRLNNIESRLDTDIAGAISDASEALTAAQKAQTAAETAQTTATAASAAAAAAKQAAENEATARAEADTELQSQINGKQDNIDSLSADEKNAFLVSLGLGKIGVISQKQNWKSDYSSYTVSDVVNGIIPQYIIDHWISLSSENKNYDGTVYFRFNEETGYFECNDLLDITLNDAILIMNYGDLSSYAKLECEGKRVRVLFSAYLGAQFANENKTFVGGGPFIERIFCQGIISINRCFSPKFNGYDMIGLIKCKEILYLNLSTITKFHSFRNYKALTTFFGIKLAKSATFIDSPFLSNESILFLIEHEVSSSSITITLHASAYARAMADESILAALEAHTNISLASA